MIRRLSIVALGLIVLPLAALAAPDSIKEIMKKGHGSKGLLDSITASAKAEKWDAAGNDSKLLKEFGESLGTLKPSKGDADSWKKFADKYKEDTAAVAAAVEKKDAKAVADGIGAIKKSCGGCHKAHK